MDRSYGVAKVMGLRMQILMFLSLICGSLHPGMFLLAFTLYLVICAEALCTDRSAGLLVYSPDVNTYFVKSML